jgi:tetratricopeptide (TPR) repeat protein
MHDLATAAAGRAIELAPDLAVAHSTLGFILFQGRLDARAAREPFERSAALGAGESTVMARYAQFCARTGRDAEATAAMRRAVALDPLNPLIHRAEGSINYAARRYEATIVPLRKALEMNPRMSRAHAEIGDALLNLGRIDEARAEFALEPAAPFRLAGLALSAERAADLPAARTTLAELVATLGDQVLYQQAQVLAQLGEIVPALECLERARAAGDAGLIYARNDPFLDPLRDATRMDQLLDEIGFDRPARAGV